MSITKIMDTIMKPNRAKQSDDRSQMLHVDFLSVEEHFNQAAERYDQARTEYFNHFINESGLRQRTLLWEKAARRLAAWTELWFNINPDKRDQQEQMLDILDRISKDSSVREQNLTEKIDRLKAEEPSEKPNTEIEKLENAEERADWFTRCALKTQQAFIDRFEKGPNASNFIQKDEGEAGQQTLRTLHLIPNGKLFKIARVFPMARVPLTERVPNHPDALTRVRYEDPENLVWDDELEELVIKPGYVSEDGLIDDKSVIWHPENNTVDIGYVGGVRTTWAYWKPKDAKDIPEEGCWLEEYRQRLWDQYVEDGTRGLLKRRMLDDDPPYNRIP